MGKGVLKSVAAVNDLVGPKIVGMDPCCQVSHARWWVSSAQRSKCSLVGRVLLPHVPFCESKSAHTSTHKWIVATLWSIADCTLYSV